MNPFQAWIIPVSGGGGNPPGIWGPTDPRPGWGLPGDQPGIWGPNDPRPGYGPVGPQPGGPRPEHPIFYPPGIWGPNDPRPGWGLPGNQPGVGAPVFPTNPIVIYPGGDPNPPQTPPGAPTAPTAPPQLGAISPETNVPGAGTVWMLGMFPGYGWLWVGVDAKSAGTGPKAK